MEFRRTFFILATTFLPFLVCQSQVEYRDDWPVITDLDTTVTINTSAEKISYKFSMKDQSGKILYSLFCYGGSTEYLDNLSDSSGSNFVGPLCFLLAIGEKKYADESLLCEDGSAPWYSRGQINDYKQLVGACGQYPEYGCLRHFRLRGFVLTLHFINIVLDKDESPVKFDVKITAHPDKNISSSIAEQTGYLSPFKKGCSCEIILKGNEPRMFRDKNGSWFEEKELIK